MQSEASPLRAWGAVALWALVVWSLGDDGFSATRTSRVLGPLVAWLFPELSDAATAQLLFGIRKAAHVVEYGLLALLSLRALRLGSGLGFAAGAAATLGLVASFAVADELRQSFSGSRSGSGADVLLDVAGAMLGLLIARALPPRIFGAALPTRDPG
jgi:VanZ family protein